MKPRTRVKQYVEKWAHQGYPSDIPDVCPEELAKTGLVPSWKQIAICLLKNDLNLTALGFTPKKTAWYSAIKRVELEERARKAKEEEK